MIATTRTSVFVFENRLVVEEHGDYLEHVCAAIAHGREPGYVGSVIVPAGNRIPTLEEAKVHLNAPTPFLSTEEAA